MPLFDPSGRPFTPGQLVGVKKLSDYPSLNEAEFKEVSRQLEEGLSAGVPENVPVTIPTGILVRLLQTVNLGFRNGDGIAQETAAAALAPEGSEAYTTPIPDVSALRERARLEEAALAEQEKQA